MASSFDSLGPEQYPRQLRDADPPPDQLWVSGQLGGATTVGIVGTRRPTPESERFTRDLAAAVVTAGGIVVSGGAFGIDAAAHEGALDAGGRTWVVMPSGHQHPYPKAHAPMYARVVQQQGAMISPFRPDAQPRVAMFYERNRILVALSHAVVIVQAGLPSGALNAARWAHSLGRPLWAIATPPWLPGFEGATNLFGPLRARPLVAISPFLRAVRLGEGPRTPKKTSRQLELRASMQPPNEPPRRPLRPDEQRVFEATDGHPRHRDELQVSSGLPSRVLSTALLTLSLEHVLVENPDGFFRRNPR